jgi:3-phosphoshikimate 1-carboxyvinyltransferase
MKLLVKKSQLDGVIAVPGSKSHSIRAVAAATMAAGRSTIYAPLESEDTRSCLNAAMKLGIQVKEYANRWEITGTGGKFVNPGNTIDMGNSGTSLRIFSGLCATAGFQVDFDGDSSLRTRPMEPLLSALEMLGVKTSSSNGKCPLSIHGPLRGGKTRVNGKSSQFLTALLFAAPTAENDTEIEVYNLNERPYVEITLGWLDRLGIKYECAADMSWFKIPGRQRFPAFDWTIPADFSTSAFPLAAGAVTGGTVAIRNLDFNDLQGDKAVFDYFKQMGAKINRGENSTEISGGAVLHGINIDLNATPDALPIMAVAGAVAQGTTRLLNVPQARIKETDRIACMTAELRKMGADITELEDGMVINGGKLHCAEVNGHGDHRIVMALAIAGMTADGVTSISTAESAAVTYPDFINDFIRLGADFTCQP